VRIESIENVLSCLKKAGEIALEEQQRIHYSDREYKSDDSVITQADRKVEQFLFAHIVNLYPEANILAEETKHPFDPTKEYTFAIDPIDGTDVYSQGMPDWCISVGLLDQKLVPIAGVVFSPSLELLTFADVGRQATVNGVELPLLKSPNSLSGRTNIMVSSRIHRHVDLSGFDGKIRSIGSAALHLCFPLIYRGVSGAVEDGGLHIWDIAGADAMNRAQGLDFELLGGGRVDYSAIVDGGPVGDVILAGDRSCVAELKKVLKRI
jgi:fructose-1,6-bisphosphatase/inositol monophosphatase family enzyme